MTMPLDFFLFLGSTYTYLTVNRIEELSARSGVAIRWRPFDVRSIMREQNNRPFVGKPVKLRYMWRDLERRADRHGLEFVAIPPYPIDENDLANRVAVVASLEDWCADFVKAAYRTWFIQGVDPGIQVNLSRVLRSIGQSPERVIERASADDVRERYLAETESARELGVFGAPTFVYGREVFWGDDRLEEALEWAQSH
jgi:2-hydroxychromene-2-carboxylate isomerase